MSAPSREALWASLVASGLAWGELPARSQERSPWYLRAMLGIVGWIGALCLFAFVGLMFSFVIENAFASIAVGALICAGAVLLFRSPARGTFAGQFGFAVSLVGQALICFGLAVWFSEILWLTALLMAVVQAALFVLIPNFAHRVWAAWTGALAAALALGDLGLYALAPALVAAAFVWLWIREFDYGARGALLRAGGYGLALALMLVTVMHGESLTGRLLEWRGGLLGGEIGVWLGGALTTAVLLWAVALLLKREGVALTAGPGAIALLGAAILGLISFKAPGVGPAAAILVVGYANGNRVLAGLGVIALLGYLSHYYYALHATLLEKSILLACAGLALLAARFALHRWWPLQTSGARRA